MPHSYLPATNLPASALPKRLSDAGACYRPGMKSSERQKGSVARPLVKELADRQKADSKVENPLVSSKPLPPPDLYQDSGGGYNPDFTFPQE